MQNMYKCAIFAFIGEYVSKMFIPSSSTWLPLAVTTPSNQQNQMTKIGSIYAFATNAYSFIFRLTFAIRGTSHIRCNCERRAVAEKKNSLCNGEINLKCKEGTSLFRIAFYILSLKMIATLFVVMRQNVNGSEKSVPFSSFFTHDWKTVSNRL